MEFRRLSATFGLRRGSALSRELSVRTGLNTLHYPDFINHVCIEKRALDQNHISLIICWKPSAMHGWSPEWENLHRMKGWFLGRCDESLFMFVWLSRKMKHNINPPLGSPPAPVFPVLFSGSLTWNITQSRQHCSLQAHRLQQADFRQSGCR